MVTNFVSIGEQIIEVNLRYYCMYKNLSRLGFYFREESSEPNTCKLQLWRSIHRYNLQRAYLNIGNQLPQTRTVVWYWVYKTALVASYHDTKDFRGIKHCFTRKDRKVFFPIQSSIYMV